MPTVALPPSPDRLPQAPGCLFDSHCHLDAAEFDRDRAQVIADAVAAGVGAILVPAVEVANFGAVKVLCAADWSGSSQKSAQQKSQQHAQQNSQKISLHATFGIHPMYTSRAGDGDLGVLRQWLQNERPVAIGEIGLDGFLPGLDMARQEWFYVEQLKLARDFDLPVLLHVRRAQDSVLKQLRRLKVRGGIAHAFNGSRQQADEFIRLGFKLGFGGTMSFEGSTRIRRLAAELPLECIVLETDAPDIPPAWLNGGRNAPAELARLAAVLAELRQTPVEEIAAVTSANARALISGLV